MRRIKSYFAVRLLNLQEERLPEIYSFFSEDRFYIDIPKAINTLIFIIIMNIFLQ